MKMREEIKNRNAFSVFSSMNYAAFLLVVLIIMIAVFIYISLF